MLSSLYRDSGYLPVHSTVHCLPFPPIALLSITGALANNNLLGSFSQYEVLVWHWGERRWESRFSSSPSALPWEASLSLLHPLPLCRMPIAVWLPLVTPPPSLVLHLPHCALLSPQLLQLPNSQFSELVPIPHLNGLRWFLTSWLLEVSRLFL